MLTFAEEITLLLLDDEAGKLAPIDATTLHVALAGAVLMDLALRDRLDSDLDTLMLVDKAPTGEPLLDECLAQIATEQRTHDTGYWVLALASRGEQLLEQALSRLVDRGILRLVDKKLMWVFETRRYPVIDNREEREVKRRLIDALMTDEIPDSRDIVLICLVEACSILPLILTARELDSAAPRIAQLKKMDLIGQAMAKVLTDAQNQLAMAAMPHG